MWSEGHTRWLESVEQAGALGMLEVVLHKVAAVSVPVVCFASRCEMPEGGAWWKRKPEVSTGSFDMEFATGLDV